MPVNVQCVSQTTKQELLLSCALRQPLQNTILTSTLPFDRLELSLSFLRESPSKHPLRLEVHLMKPRGSLASTGHGGARPAA